MSAAGATAVRVTKKELRSFGLLVGGVFGVLGLWPVIFRHQSPRWWVLTLAAYLVISALIAANSLSLVYKLWMRLGHVMGWINTRLILGLAFFGLVTPIGVLRSRVLRKDPMGRSFRPDLNTYRVASKTRSASHLTKPY